MIKPPNRGVYGGKCVEMEYIMAYTGYLQGDGALRLLLHLRAPDWQSRASGLQMADTLEKYFNMPY